MDGYPWRILLVEDDEDDFLLTRALLRDFQVRAFELIWAPDPGAALQRLSTQVPDVVLVDYALGATTGLDFIRQALAAGCPAPFILLTGQGDYEVDLQAMQAGAVDFLPKHQLSPATLERSIRYAIERNATERALRQAQEELERRVQERTEQLQQANQLLEKVFIGIHLQIAYLDRDFNFIRVNQNYADQNGHDPDYFVGKNHFDLYPDEEAEAIFRRVVESGENYYAFARPFIHPEQIAQGTTYWDWSLQPVKEPDGRTSGLVLSLLDVTGRERASQQLRAREELLRAVVTGAPVILWAVDRQGVITLSEGRGLEKLGLAQGQLVGQPASTFLPLSSEVEDYLRCALEGEEVVAVIQFSGVSFYTRFLPHDDADGQTIGIIAVSTDITDRVQAESSLAYQAGLLERVNDAIVATDERFKLTTWNRAAEKIYGWKAEEVIGKQVEEVLGTESRAANGKSARQALAETGQFQGEVVQLHRDGHPIFVDMKVTTLYEADGRVSGYVSVNRDITERKRIQAELAEVQRQLLESVEAERQHIARELHDGPMQELYALAYEIEGLRSGPSAEETCRRIDALQAKLRQVSQTLRATATELRPPTLAPFGLEKAIRSHAERFQQDYPELRVSLHLEPDGQSLPERVRLALFRIYQQALANVVRHARATEVDIQLILGSEQVSLEVHDNGMGFAVPARWVELARAGHLGLVGAQERANAVGGTLSVISGNGQGTLIRVRVPR